MSLKTWHFLTAYFCHQRGHWQVMCLLTQRQQGAESTCQDAQVSGWPTSDNYVTSPTRLWWRLKDAVETRQVCFKIMI